MLSLFLEQQSFTILDIVFSMPARAETVTVAAKSTGLPFDRKQYRDYYVVARK